MIGAENPIIDILRACAAVILVALAPASRGGGKKGDNYLQVRVCRFIFHGKKRPEIRHHQRLGMPGDFTEAVRQLAHHAEVPISLESIPFRPTDKVCPVEIDVKNRMVEEILDEMVSQDPRYSYRERLGVIEVFPKGADRDPADCLNIVIPVFRTKDYWNDLIEQLRCEVDIVSRDPKAYVPFPGCGGSYPGIVHPPPGLIDANFEQQTLRDILDRLCAQAGNIAWNVSCQRAASGHAIEMGMYHLRQWVPSETLPVTFSEGLPKTCTQCHYHKPCHDK